MKILPCLIGRRVLPISRGLPYLKAVFFGLIFVILWHQRNLNISTKFFPLFSLFFAFFALNFLLRFDLVIFASKRNKAKRNSSIFFCFFCFFSLFFAFFRFCFALFPLIFVSLRFFHLIFAYFTFVFASDFWCFTSKWIMWNQAFFSLPSETKFSLQFQISLPKRKWGRTLLYRVLCLTAHWPIPQV